MEIVQESSNPLKRQVTIETMPYGRAIKRRKTARSSRVSYKRKTAVPRNIGLPANNTCMIPLTTKFDWTIDNVARANFTFDVQNITIAGATNTSPGTWPINGAAELVSVFHMARVAKVEMNFVPSSTGNDYSTGSAVNVPTLGTTVNYISSALPSLVDMMQKPGYRSDMLTKQIKRTFYPRLEGSNGIIDVGANRRNLFESMDSSSTQKWRGVDVSVDNMGTVSSNQTMAIYVTVFLECMSTR